MNTTPVKRRGRTMDRFVTRTAYSGLCLLAINNAMSVAHAIMNILVNLSIALSILKEEQKGFEPLEAFTPLL
jgi:hypothetical protein